MKNVSSRAEDNHNQSRRSNQETIHTLIYLNRYFNLPAFPSTVQNSNITVQHSHPHNPRLEFKCEAECPPIKWHHNCRAPSSAEVGMEWGGVLPCHLMKAKRTTLTPLPSTSPQLPPSPIRSHLLAAAAALSPPPLWYTCVKAKWQIAHIN